MADPPDSPRSTLNEKLSLLDGIVLHAKNAKRYLEKTAMEEAMLSDELARYQDISLIDEDTWKEISAAKELQKKLSKEKKKRKLDAIEAANAARRILEATNDASQASSGSMTSHTTAVAADSSSSSSDDVHVAPEQPV